MEKFLTFTEMSTLLGISKSRLYELIRDGIFPAPLRNPSNNRPVFNSELIETCRQVVKTRVGANGKPYTPNKRRKAAATTNPRGRHESLVASLSALGVNATAKQVDEAVKTLPDAGKGMEEGEVVKRVFLLLRKGA